MKLIAALLLFDLLIVLALTACGAPPHGAGLMGAGLDGGGG
jgi:hypothetical protein